jgi:hypothetical protein
VCIEASDYADLDNEGLYNTYLVSKFEYTMVIPFF